MSIDRESIESERVKRAMARFQETGKLTDLEESKDAMVALGWLRCDVKPDGQKFYTYVREDRIRHLLGDPNDS